MKSEALKKHYQWQGKIGVEALVEVKDMKDLALAYTPGVADACLEIKNNPDKSFVLTRRWNTVAVITDGSAVLGLGDIGPEASMPVMEGKCLLFKRFANIDAIPLCIKTKDVNELVNTISLLSANFGGINLEDIAAPRCFEVEERLKERLDIPVFHDDQHGTAIVVAAALKNALRLVKKDITTCRIIINGAGAAGMAIGEMLLNMQAKDLMFVDKIGILNLDNTQNENKRQSVIARCNNKQLTGDLTNALKKADVFIGVSAGNILNVDMLSLMNENAIVFAMANPVPEVMPDVAKAAHVAVIGTGRSDFSNQINNLLAFPGVFKGALMSRAKTINEAMKIAAVDALASLVSDDELSSDFIIPSVFDQRVVAKVSEAVVKAAYETNVAQK
ncbi:MAG: NADP-dependent malic enzyme [Erysipelotrichaceae bacterium]|nr:NADP-dependent malic enzyme [Erysipelotrichaceae bacterium]